jgi:hypothetical protein
MALFGIVRKGVVILDKPHTLKEGTQVRVKTLPIKSRSSKPRKSAGQTGRNRGKPRTGRVEGGQ